MLDSELFSEHTPLADYRSSVWRIIESQEEAATLMVVDDIEEQMVLEALLDDAKPAYRAGTSQMHYLLKTAFRYPPLNWGSRFGTRLMPSYFYASEAAVTALSECAYYRFLFLQDMLYAYTDPIRSEFCVFSVSVNSKYCLDLTANDFSPLGADISNPTSYLTSQAIGQWVTERDDIEVIRFASARDAGGINVAIKEPRAIRSRQATAQERWQCLTKPDVISFSSRSRATSYQFSITNFCDGNGVFLRVAN